MLSTPATHLCPVIGILGGIGSGKSFVAAAFAELGCVVSDSDAQVRELLATADLASTIEQWWGPEVVVHDENGMPRQVNRAKVAAIVFANPAERTRLEGLLHPMLKHRRQALIAASRAQAKVSGQPTGVVLDAPLLLEAGLEPECDALVFVECDPGVRAARVLLRGWGAEELARRQAAQMPLLDKRARAGYILSNMGDAAETRRQAALILLQIQQSIAGR